MRMAAGLVMAALAGAASAQEVTYLGAFETAGKSVSVAPLDGLRLEYCFETTSGLRDCIVTGYELSEGMALFRNRDAEPLAFDLVNNVLVWSRGDGTEAAADMTPVAR